MSEAGSLSDRIRAEMADTLDEELELELDDERLTRLVEDRPTSRRPTCSTARIYFSELFRLQGELVKLQDWVVAHRS